MDTIDSSTTPEAHPRPAASQTGLWLRIMIVVLLLATSAGVRAWQTIQVGQITENSKTSPFPLKEIPLQIGHWQGTDGELDDFISRIAGAVDNVSRQYVDDRTGVQVNCIIVFGPAHKVMFHSPERCYPTSGFRQDGGRRRVEVSTTSGTVPFTQIVYQKDPGGLLDRREVLFSWYYSGSWETSIGAARRMERVGGMIKVHVDRMLTDNEDVVTENNITEDFLRQLLPEIEARLNAASTSSAANET